MSRTGYKPLAFNRANVLKHLQSCIDNCNWRRNNLPLSDSLKAQMITDVQLLEELQSDIREMSAP